MPTETTAPPRLHVVSGKGGTGKSTVAAALALALARQGKRVLLCEVEGRQGIAQVLGRPPLGYEEQLVVPAEEAGGEVYALAIDAESAMREYLRLFYRLGGRTASLLDRFGVLEFATSIAPGLRDVILTGKIYEAVDRNARNKHARSYDAVVVDAPPTGRITTFLNVNNEFGELAKVGPVKGQAESVTALLTSSRTAIHLVTVLEEMPVQETADGVAELRSHGFPVRSVIVNLTRPRVLEGASLRSDGLRSALAESLGRGSLDVTDALLDGLVSEVAVHAERGELEDQQRVLVARTGLPTYELPLLPDGIDRAALHELATTLLKGGLA